MLHHGLKVPGDRDFAVNSVFKASTLMNRLPNVIGVLPLFLCWAICAEVASKAQDLLGDDIRFSGATLHLKTYVDPGPDRRIISMTTQPAGAGNPNLFVTTQDGAVYSVQDNGFGGMATEWFNYNAAVNVAVNDAGNGFVLENPTGAHGGLRSVAFHPEFASNGKFYTSAMVDRPEGVEGINYIGNSSSGFDGESAVVEWTYDHDAQQVDASSYRELFRVQMPVFDHPVKQIAFNNFAQPGDEDYGLLYITHGDGSVQSAIAGGGLIRDDALGKVLRVNPLEDGANPYSTPGNPFNNTPGTLDEIFTLGHRNPHHISFAEDSGGNSHIVIAEGGRDNIEEINVLQPGGSYGWSDREGTFIHNRSGGYGLGNGVSSLPANEWQLNDFIYPAAQYDHDSKSGQGFVGSIVAGGFVIDNDSDPALQGEYVFADFGGRSGNVYQVTLTDLLSAHTRLADGEAPSELTQAPISRLQLTLDEDGDGAIDRTADNLNSLFETGRNDARFGRGPNGEMFISSKQTGLVYLVTNTVVEHRLVLTVNLATGVAAITNPTAVAREVAAYTISSASGNIHTAGWESFESQGVDDGDWLASVPALATRITEEHENGATTFDHLARYEIGNLYVGGNRDFAFEFLLVGDSQTMEGTVVFQLPGDFDGDGTVTSADFLAWQRGDSPALLSQVDFADWQANFGFSALALVAAVSVPEPACLPLLLVACGMSNVLRGQRRRD